MKAAAATKRNNYWKNKTGERRNASLYKRLKAWFCAWRRVVIAEILCCTCVEIV